MVYIVHTKRLYMVYSPKFRDLNALFFPLNYKYGFLKFKCLPLVCEEQLKRHALKTTSSRRSMWSNLNSRTIFWNLKIDNFFSGSYVLPKFIILSVSVYGLRMRLHLKKICQTSHFKSYQTNNNKKMQLGLIYLNRLEQFLPKYQKLSFRPVNFI